MNYSVDIPQGSAEEFLKRLKAQCLPYEKRPFVPDGGIYCSVDFLKFSLYTVGPNMRESRIEGIAWNSGKVTWSYAAHPVALIFFMLWNLFLWGMVFLGMRGDNPLSAFLGGCVMTGMSFGVFLLIIRQGKSVGTRLEDLIRDTARMMATPEFQERGVDSYFLLCFRTRPAAPDYPRWIDLSKRRAH